MFDPKFRTSEKLVVSGSVIEVFKYDDFFEVANRSKYGVTSQNRAVSFRRLVNCNAGIWRDVDSSVIMPKFLTLTFADNILDLAVANKIFMKFVIRLNRRFFKKGDRLAYLAVPEFQKRGAVHYHVLFFNLPFVFNVFDELNKLWGYGHLLYKALDSASDASWYMAKYMTKSLSDERFKGKKRYFGSRNLNRPFVTYDLILISDILDLVNSRPLFSSRFQNQKGSNCEYMVFDISDSPLCGLDLKRLFISSLDSVSAVVDKSFQGRFFEPVDF
jgi:hypothetical protein